MARITREEMLMEIASTVAKRGTCTRASVGAVLAVEGRIISIGYVGSPPGTPHCLDEGCILEDGGCVRTQHAEANAIAWAARMGIPTEGSTLYVTLAPCLPCAKMIVTAGITHVAVGSYYRKMDGAKFLKSAGVKVQLFPFWEVA